MPSSASYYSLHLLATNADHLAYKSVYLLHFENKTKPQVQASVATPKTIKNKAAVHSAGSDGEKQDAGRPYIVKHWPVSPKTKEPAKH